MPTELNAKVQASIDNAEHVTLRNAAGKHAAITWANFKSLITSFLVKGDVGLGSVDNTTDLAKPISTATQTALDLKAQVSQAVPTPTSEGEVLSPDGAGSQEWKSQLDLPALTIDGGLL